MEHIETLRAMPSSDARNRLVPGRGFLRFKHSEIEQPIQTRFERQATRFAQHCAVRTAEGSINYGELNARANRIAHAILALRPDGEEPVAVLLDQGINVIAAILGALKAGKIYVPLDPTHSEPRSAAAVENCDPPLILTSAAHVKLCTGWLGESRAVIDVGAIDASCQSENPGLAVPADRLAYIFYTSGSTGRPKGVADCHRNVLHNIMRYTNSLLIGSGDRVTLLQSCAFSGSVSSLFSALLNGASVHPIDLRREGIAGIAQRISSEGITVYHSVPTIFRQLVAIGRRLRSLRVVRLEGDLASARDAELFQHSCEPGCVLVNGLGATETGLTRQYFVATDSPIEPGNLPIGYPTEDMEIRLFDEDGAEVHAGIAGEIVVRSRYLAVGYWGRPDLTTNHFRADPDGRARLYHTGDLGRLHPDGCLELLGRRDFHTKIDGRWIDTAALEGTLRDIPNIDDAVVMARSTAAGRNELIAYLVVAADPPSLIEIRGLLRERLPGEVQPSMYVVLDSLPLDSNGKVDRKALPAVDRHRPPLSTPLVAARDALDETIIACWREVLEIDEIGVHDDFLELGGDSLKALEVAMLLEERVGHPITAEALIEASNPAALAEQLARGIERAGVVVLKPGRTRPLFCFLTPQGGNILGYRKLALQLPTRQAVYGVQVPRQGRRDASLARVDVVARICAEEIRHVQPSGPYALAGNCWAGVVALEVGRYLLGQGEPVDFVALIDTAFPRTLAARLPAQLRAARSSEVGPIRYAAHKLASLPSWCTARARRRALEIAWQVCRVARRPVPTALFDPIEGLRLAMTRYRPQPYPGRAVLICPGVHDSHRGWETVVRGPFTTVLLPEIAARGTRPHLVDEPHVGPLGEAMTALLEDLEESAPYSQMSVSKRIGPDRRV